MKGKEILYRDLRDFNSKKKLLESMRKNGEQIKKEYLCRN